MKKLIEIFGFDSTADFVSSTARPEAAKALVFLSAFAAIVDALFGIHPYLLAGLVLLVILELFSGIMAAFVNKKQIESRRWQRFVFKFLAYLILLFILHALTFQEEQLVRASFSWLKSAFITYIALGYLISVLENLNAIRGRALPVNFLDQIREKFNLKPKENDADKK